MVNMTDDMMNTEIPDPIGILLCPDCEKEFDFSQEGARGYMLHWALSHNSRIVYLGSGKPEIKATIKVTKEDGTEYEVPIEI